MKLQLERPLVFFDLETTGLNIATDRIVEMSYYKLYPNGESESNTLRIKPVMKLMGQDVVMPIPAESTAVHGITDKDVADCPTFEQVAEQIAEVFSDADIAGYNSNHFDIPVLAEEFIRAGVDIDLGQCRRIDVYTIFQRKEPRNLTAAYRFYCGKDLNNAHSANADTMATYEVLMAQLERYEDVPGTIDGLQQFTSDSTPCADLAGRIGLDESGREIFNFGKYKGKRVEDVFRTDTGYYGWLMGGDFPQYTKNVFRKIYFSLRK